jgi:hypothetical protein
MSDAFSHDFETLLREALHPVDPPEDLIQRLESTLTNLAGLAADELEGWELSAMRDPRNWARPVAAVAIGTTAGAALVLVRARQHQKRRRGQSKDVLDFAERTVRDIAGEARRLIDRG